MKKRKAEEEARQRAQEKEFMKGLDYLRDVRLKIHLEEKKNFFGLIIQCIEFVIDWITPLKDQTKVIVATQIKPIQSFFIAFRGLITASIYQLLFFIPFYFANFIG